MLWTEQMNIPKKKIKADKTLLYLGLATFAMLPAAAWAVAGCPGLPRSVEAVAQRAYNVAATPAPSSEDEQQEAPVSASATPGPLKLEDIDVWPDRAPAKRDTTVHPEYRVHFPLNLYTYPAKLVRVLDGDTYELDLDLGFGLIKREIFRDNKWNTPEKNAMYPKDHPNAGERDYPERERARKATLAVKAWFSLYAANGHVIVRTTLTRRGGTKEGKYGRPLVAIYPGAADQLPDENLGKAQYKSLGQHLADLGYAELYKVKK